MSKLTLKQVVKGLFDALNAKKADRSDLEGLATASDVDAVQDEVDNLKPLIYAGL